MDIVDAVVWWLVILAAVLTVLRYRSIRFRNRMRRKFVDVAVNEQRVYGEIHELRQEIKSIRAAATPMTGPPRAGADLTSPAPAVSPGDRYPWRMENDEDDGA